MLNKDICVGMCGGSQASSLPESEIPIHNQGGHLCNEWLVVIAYLKVKNHKSRVRSVLGTKQESCDGEAEFFFFFFLINFYFSSCDMKF